MWVAHEDPDGLWRCMAHSQSEAAAKSRADAASKAKAKRQQQTKAEAAANRRGGKRAKKGKHRQPLEVVEPEIVDLDEERARRDPAKRQGLRSLEDCLAELENVLHDAKWTATPAEVLRARTAAVKAAQDVLTHPAYVDPNAKAPEARPVKFGTVANVADYRKLLESNLAARVAAGEDTTQIEQALERVRARADGTG